VYFLWFFDGFKEPLKTGLKEQLPYLPAYWLPVGFFKVEARMYILPSFVVQCIHRGSDHVSSVEIEG
jgi:hypothetical protein